jgi:hypothetical protein
MRRVRLNNEAGILEKGRPLEQQQTGRNPVMSNTTYLNPNAAIARTREQHANIIRADLRKSAEGIIAAGLHLLQAKTELRGEFQEMVKTELGWNQDKAEMFMAIARNQVLTSPQICGLLPPSYGTLHLMSKVDPVVLETKLKDGTFSVDTEMSEVRPFLPKPKKRKTTKPRKAKVKTPTEEITGVADPALVKPMPAWERLHVRDIRSELVDELTEDPNAAQQFDQAMAAIKAKAGVMSPQDVNTIRPVDDDDGVAAILAAAVNKYGDRPPPPATPGPVEEMSAEGGRSYDRPLSIVPENAPGDDDFPEMPEFLRRKEEIREALLERQPYLRHDPDRLEEMVAERIR